MPSRCTDAEARLPGQPRSERRSSHRQPCRTSAECRAIIYHRQQSRWARATDISTAGVGLVTSGPFDAGALVLIELSPVPGARPLTFLAEVARCELLPDGTWALGCRFDSLRSDLPAAARDRVQYLLSQPGALSGAASAALAEVSAEFDNPLRSLLAPRPPMPDGAGGESPSRLGGAINLLFDLLLITRGRLPLRRERLAVEGLVTPVLKSLRPFTELLDLRLRSSLPAEPLFIDVDRGRLEWALAHLVLDLVQRSAPGAALWLTARRDGEALVLCLGAARLEAAVEPMPAPADLLGSPAPADRTPVGWEDVRQAVTRGIIEAHGGSARAMNLAARSGGEFEIRLPLAPAARREA